MWQAEFKLYLYPNDSSLLLDKSTLESVLSDIEFIGKKQAEYRFEVGDKFLSLLCFMGCSPNIELEPQENKPYCYIEIETVQAAQFISGKNRRKVVCPECKTTLENIGAIFLKDTKDLNKYDCPECNKHTFNLNKMNWRKTAFLARSWVMVGNIYESEAVPDEKLLKSLKELTGVEWKVAYIRAIDFAKIAMQ